MNDKYIINGAVLYAPDENRLTPLGKRGEETILNAPVNRCLLLLIQHAGGVVSQETLLAEVWEKHGQYVTMNTLYQNILLLRRGMLNSGILKSPIKTIPKIGVKFTGDIKIIGVDSEAVTVNESMIPSVDTPAYLSVGKEESALDVEESISDNEETNNDVTRGSLSDFFRKKIISTRTSSLALNGIKRVKSSNRLRINFFLLICCIFLSGLLAYSVINTGFTFSGFFLSQYKKIGSVGECHVYINSLDRNEVNIGEIIVANEINCSERTYVYITTFQYSKNQSLLLCNRPLDDATAQECYVRNTLEGGKV